MWLQLPLTLSLHTEYRLHLAILYGQIPFTLTILQSLSQLIWRLLVHLCIRFAAMGEVVAGSQLLVASHLDDVGWMDLLAAIFAYFLNRFVIEIVVLLLLWRHITSLNDMWLPHDLLVDILISLYLTVYDVVLIRIGLSLTVMIGIIIAL